jgi:hypothetical protein
MGQGCEVQGMTKHEDEQPRKSECLNDEGRARNLFRHSDFVIPSSLEIRHSCFGTK